MGVPSFPPKPKEWLPASPPAPPIPRWLYRNVKGAVPFKAGGSSPPELPKIPKEAEEAEDIVSSVFQTTRGIHSTMQTRREIDRLLREPTKIFPFGER